jgi:hypothetical protein
MTLKWLCVNAGATSEQPLSAVAGEPCVSRAVASAPGSQPRRLSFGLGQRVAKTESGSSGWYTLEDDSIDAHILNSSGSANYHWVQTLIEDTRTTGANRYYHLDAGNTRNAGYANERRMPGAGSRAHDRRG